MLRQMPRAPPTPRVWDPEGVGGTPRPSTLWRAVFDLPQPAVRVDRARLSDGSCFVSDQVSSAAVSGSEPEPLAPDFAEASSAVAELQQLLLATEDITGFLDELTALTVKVLPGELSCGITLRRDRGATTVASSDHRASQVDEIQYGHHEGPCLRALATGQVVVVDDLAQDDRWGGYRVPALGHGVRSSLSLPLRVHDTTIGALNIYATRPRAFGPAEQLVAGRFADEASRALALAVRLAEHGEMSAHLQAALASRAVIDQAVGIIVGQNRCTTDEAFEVLRSISNNRNVKLRDVATHMVASVSGQPPTDTPRFS
jgi:transcriptional regulator with GAF, ATPase, and Fis domain